MGLFAEAWNPRPRASSAPDALNSFWYTTDTSGYVMESSPSGITLSADTILRCGTVYAAVKFRGSSWSMCPPSTSRKTGAKRKELPDHYSQLVLRNPNRWMTGNRWRHLNGVWMALWGNAYNEMVAGPRSFADELRPLHPSVTRVVDQRADGSLLYLHTPPGQPERRLGQEKVLRFMDLSTDGIQGVPMYRLIRNVVGIAMLAERHAMTFLTKGSRISGLLVPDKALDADQRKTLRESVNQDLGGTQATGTFGIMPHGVDVKPITATHKESQFVELGDQVVGAILRFLDVPGVVVGYADKTATYASAKEFFESGGIKHCVLPILANVEAEEEKALLADSDMQIKHNLDVLLRANTKDRFEALFKATGRPWMTGNEARAIEDMNPDDDPSMDKVLLPSNMMTTEPEPEPEPPPFLPSPSAPPDGDDDEDDAEPSPASPEDPSALRAAAARARWLAQSAAARIVRREIAAIRGGSGTLGAARRYAKDADGWEKWVSGYYERHSSHVAEALHISLEKATAYAEGQRIALLTEGVAVIETWQEKVVPRLVALAMED